MNQYFNFKYPEFIQKYGQDWTQFKSIVETQLDYYFRKIYEITYYNNVNYLLTRPIEVILGVLRIPFSADDTLLAKKIKLRTFVSQYKKKGLADIYLDIQESIVGVRGNIVSGQSLGVWRWDYSKWRRTTGLPFQLRKNPRDIRWALAGSQFEIYIYCATSDSAILDQIQSLYREKSLLPAFYKIYLTDIEYNILRAV